jgi:TPP-dependent pyruvate/acetoin dehydrogenase alpha subunit
VKAGNGPFFLEARTYRFRAHSMFDAELYRDKAEVEEWKKRDPIVLLRERNLVNDAEFAAMDAAVLGEIANAVAFAEAGTWEPIEHLTRHVYATAQEETP